MPSLRRWDRRTFDRIAGKPMPRADRALPQLSRAADYSRLWAALAVGFAALGGRFGRRAAMRGLVSLGATSAIVNLPIKRLFRRPRPRVANVPVERRLYRQLRGTSFPSGHAASAFAFAVAASCERPAAAPVLVPLAGAVAFSRVFCGVHHPSDVIGGAAIGTAIALASHKVWPRAPRESPVPERARAHRGLAAPGGAGCTIAVNVNAGPALSANPADELRELLPAADIVELDDPGKLEQVLSDAAADAEAIGAAGGDGSLGTAAAVAARSGRPLLIVPAGTLNHLARDLGLSNASDAASALESGETVRMDVAQIADRVFVNTASFGAYTELVDAREQLESSIGKWPALVVALVRVLRHATPMDVEIDGVRRRVWMSFIGNCRYHPDGFAPSWRDHLDDGLLDVRLVDGSSPFARVRLVLSILTGTLAHSRVHQQMLVRELRVRSLDGPARLAADGETFDGPEEFVVRKLPDRIDVYVPKD